MNILLIFVLGLAIFYLFLKTHLNDLNNTTAFEKIEELKGEMDEKLLHMRSELGSMNVNLMCVSQMTRKLSELESYTGYDVHKKSKDAASKFVELRS